jgi:hypothetical protein
MILPPHFEVADAQKNNPRGETESMPKKGLPSFAWPKAGARGLNFSKCPATNPPLPVPRRRKEVSERTIRTPPGFFNHTFSF